jgi:hypothetical protein
MMLTTRGEEAMFKNLMMIALVSISLLAISAPQAKAYNYQGYGGCYGGCGSYRGSWTLTGGQRPGNTAVIVGDFTIQIGALVCVNPGTNQRDVRSGVGGITNIQVVSSEDELAFDARGFFTLDQHVLSTVPEFEAFCDQNQTTIPQECFQCGDGDDLCTGRELFNLTYGVSDADCRNDNWTTFEYLWGNHCATGTVFRDCTNPTDPSTCARVDDNVTYSCTTNVNLKNYSKVGTVNFTCTETQCP